MSKTITHSHRSNISVVELTEDDLTDNGGTLESELINVIGADAIKIVAKGNTDPTVQVFDSTATAALGVDVKLVSDLSATLINQNIDLRGTANNHIQIKVPTPPVDLKLLVRIRYNLGQSSDT